MKRNGFSLMELMIVIIILGLLASLVLPNLMGKGEEAKEKLVCVQMKNISATLDMFKLDNSTYPSTEEGLESLLKNPDEEKYPSYAPNAYLEKSIPKDSWKTPFIYVETEGDFDLISLGSDRKEGGEKGSGSDIKFSECKF